MSSDAGKGDKQRPCLVPIKEYVENWEQTFNKNKEKQDEKEQDENKEDDNKTTATIYFTGRFRGV